MSENEVKNFKNFVELKVREYWDFTKKKWNTPFLEQLKIPLQWLPQPIRFRPVPSRP